MQNHCDFLKTTYPERPCTHCAHAMPMEFDYSETKDTTGMSQTVYCQKIGHLLDFIPKACKGFESSGPTE